MSVSYSSSGGTSSPTIIASNVSSGAGSFSSSKTSFVDANGSVSATVNLYNRNDACVPSEFEGGYFRARYQSSVSGSFN
ncbi:MAG: hypothetical protein VX642_09120 [Bdellovibrionota bacterium]|nr:hypothetical protein [Bdellovibrionota bacterium]